MRTQLFAEKENIKENINSDSFLKKQLYGIEKDAEVFLKEPVRSLRYSDFKIFYETGSRKEYEYEYFYHRRRLNDFAILSAVYKDNSEYFQHLQDAVWAVLDEFTWALPAHIPFKSSSEEIKTHIDLFAAETAFTLAEISVLFEGRFDKAVEERIKYEVRKRIIEPYLSGRKNSWDELENNWSAVCAGSVGSAFLYLAEDSEIKSVLPRLCNTLNCYLAGFGDDGACVEGLNYWIYGFGYFTYFAQLLYEYTGGEENLFENSKVRHIAMFPQKIYFKNNKTVSFSDCGNKFMHRYGLMNFLAQKYDGVTVPDNSSALNFDGDTCYRFAHLIRDFVWRGRTEKSEKTERSSFEYFKDAQWYVKTCGAYEFAAKAGRNNESHNHNDVGSFLLNVNGRSIITDPGRGEYTADYFSEKRYGYFAPSALAHSVPVINGNSQKEGEMRFGKILEADNNRLVIEFEKAYDDNSLQKLVRTFEFFSDKIMITDNVKFNKDQNIITEHFVFEEKPEVFDDGLKAGGIYMSYDTDIFNCTISEKTFAANYDTYKTVYTADLECMADMEKEIKFEINLSGEDKDEQ